jgi:large subunit ribosomal protein L23
MAIFKRTPKKAAAAPKAEASAPAKVKAAAFVASSHVLLSPRVTEKAAIGTEAGVYVFNVTKAATKPLIASAIKELFKVTPAKVCIVNNKPSRTKTRATGRLGKTNANKKAYVYLKKGEKIELA